MAFARSHIPVLNREALLLFDDTLSSDKGARLYPLQERFQKSPVSSQKWLSYLYVLIRVSNTIAEQRQDKAKWGLSNNTTSSH